MKEMNSNLHNFYGAFDKVTKDGILSFFGTTMNISSILLCSLLLLADLCFAHYSTLEINVLDFQSHGNDEYTIVFEAEDTMMDDKFVPEKERKYIVHIRFDPKRAQCRYLDLTLEKYRQAIKLLKQQIVLSKSLTICRLSDIGYSQIKGRKGHYRSEALYIEKVNVESEDYVCFCHSVWGASPD